MSEITKPIILDETGHLIVEGIARQNLLLAQMVQVSEATPAAELAEIHRIVQSGEAPNVFSIGEQLMLNWSDGTNQHVLPFDIVHFGDVELADGEVRPGMFIQSHYAMQGVQFSATQAAVYCAEALPAGTYHFEIGTTWGNNCVAGKNYQFITTQEVPAGGQIVLGDNNGFYTWGAPDKVVTNWRVYTFASNTSTTPLETLEISEGTGGTSIGTLSSSTKFGAAGATNLQMAAYGYNRWSHSALRQQLNSRAAAGAWWTPQHDVDRPPQQLATVRGFMAGFDDAFLSIINPVKIRTALNAVNDSEIGTYEDTVDTFFCPSLEQEYIVPQLANTEGEYWEYWKQRLGLTSPQVAGTVGANAFHIRYAFDAKTSAQNVRLRSANRGTANNTWNVGTVGNATSSNATYANRPAPACVIC